MPADKICEKLKKKDPQICDLRYGIYIYIFFVLIVYYKILFHEILLCIRNNIN